MTFSTVQRWTTGAVMTALVAASALAGCGGGSEPGPEVVAGSTPRVRNDRPDREVATSEDPLVAATAPTPSTSTTTKAVRELAVGEMETTTTTTSPTEVRLGGDLCAGDQTLRVRVEGADGKPVTAQISADYKRNGRKVDANDNPIPDDQYSQTAFINRESGVTEVCFPAVPLAEVYLEVYPKDYADGVYSHRSRQYGSVMWHGVWAGPGQAVFLRVPVACGPEQSKGRTGTVNASFEINGEDRALRRLVAWSRAEGSSKNTPGFAVADAAHYGTPDVKRIETVAADQDYLVQIQTTDEKIATVDHVPVEACKETDVEVTVTNKDCSAKINGGEPKDCKLLSKQVG